MATQSCPQSTLLHKVAKGVLDSDPVQDAMMDLSPLDEEMEYDPAIIDFSDKAKPEIEMELDSEVAYPAAVLALRQMTDIAAAEEATGFRPRFGIGDEVVKSTVRVSTKGSRTDFIHAHSQGGSYPALSKELAKLDMSDQEIAAGIRSIVQGQDPSKVSEENGPLLADLAALFFVTEPSRNQATVATAPMMLDLIENHGMSFQQFLDDKKFDTNGLGGGLFPMSFRGAVPASRSLTGPESYPGPLGKEKQTEEMLLREKELVNTWLKANKVKPPGTKEIQSFVNKTYGLQ